MRRPGGGVISGHSELPCPFPSAMGEGARGSLTRPDTDSGQRLHAEKKKP